VDDQLRSTFRVCAAVISGSGLVSRKKKQLGCSGYRATSAADSPPVTIEFVSQSRRREGVRHVGISWMATVSRCIVTRGIRESMDEADAEIGPSVTL